MSAIASSFPIDVSNWSPRLERGELLHLPVAPFALPAGDDLEFLFTCRLHGTLHKSVSFNPQTRQLTGGRRALPEQVHRLQHLLEGFGTAASDWLARTFPNYASGWYRDRISYRPEEEATRRLRWTARNDLLHIDSFPTRPTHGARILRLFVNLHPTDDRVWATSDTFPTLLARYGEAVGLPVGNAASWTRWWRQRVLALFPPAQPRRSVYDDFMLRLHHFLKNCDEFQENSIKRIWHFPPRSLWLAFTDGLSHAELRGQYALEHSFFVPVEVLSLPEEAPVRLLQQACQNAHLRRSA